MFLSGSNFIDLRKYGGGNISSDYPLFKIEGCFTDGHCNIGDLYIGNREFDNFFNRCNDDEAKEFQSKITQLYYDKVNIKTNIKKTKE